MGECREVIGVDEISLGFRLFTVLSPLFQELVFFPFIPCKQIQPAEGSNPGCPIVMGRPERLLLIAVIILVVESDRLTNLPCVLCSLDQRIHRLELHIRRPGASLRFLQLIPGRQRHLVIVQFHGKNRFKPRSGFDGLIFGFGECDRFPIDQFPVLRLVSR